MKRIRFTEEQDHCSSARSTKPVRKHVDLARKHGIWQLRWYNWKAKYGGMDVSDAPSVFVRWKKRTAS